MVRNNMHAMIKRRKQISKQLHSLHYRSVVLVIKCGTAHMVSDLSSYFHLSKPAMTILM